MFLFSLITESEKESISRLITFIAKGDDEALAAIYDMVGGRLLSVAMGITRNIALAEDVISEGFIKIVKFADQFRGGNGYAWLCTIIKNTALNIIKREKQLQGQDIDSFFDLTDERDYAEDSAGAMDMEKAMKQLTALERTCIWLRYFNEFSIREIAKEISLSKSSVQEIIKRAEKKLKELLK